MHATGIARQDDPDGCRWVAVRHAPDHVHLVAVLARQDGDTAKVWNDYYQVRDVCRAAEQRYGLRPTAPADRTAPKAPTRKEWNGVQHDQPG